MGEAVPKKLAFLMQNDHRSATSAKLCHLSPAWAQLFIVFYSLSD